MSSSSTKNKSTKSNNNNNNTSIELVSEDGPMPINIMMQEGVKALTKILSNQLQDRKVFDNPQQSMQFVIRNTGGKIIKDSSHNGTSPQKQNGKMTSDDEIVELDNQSNYHVNDKSATTLQSNVLNNDDVQNFLDEEFQDPELHLDDEEGEIIFDYETHDLMDAPDGIGERISQMIESVLPNGFPKDAHGRLHAVVNGDELNITEEGDGGDDEHNQHIRPQYAPPNGRALNQTSMRRHGYDDHADAEGAEEDIDEELFEHEGCCPHHQRHGQLSEFRNYNYHDFEYLPSQVKQPPNFSVLLEQGKPMCMFCEYYMVFGEPPRNMIKWYNRTYGYNRLPHSNDRHHNHNHNHNHRKRNR